MEVGGMGNILKPIISTDFILKSKCTKNRLAAGLCPDPLGEFKRYHGPPSHQRAARKGNTSSHPKPQLWALCSMDGGVREGR